MFAGLSRTSSPCAVQETPAFVSIGLTPSIARGGYANCNGNLQHDVASVKFLQLSSPGFRWVTTDAANVASVPNLFTYPGTNKLWGRIAYNFNFYFGFIVPGVGITSIFPIQNPDFTYTGNTFEATNSTGFQVLTCYVPV